ncbi:MAG: hypothetical protein ACE5KG_05300 [Nitrososphaerales archaeon]
MQNPASSSRSRKIAASASLGALAVILSQVPLPAFPFLFLRIDLAEVIDVLSFLLLGPSWGLLTLLIHWFGLNLLPSFLPIIGPFMKLLAVLSMFLGFWITGKIWRMLVKRKGSGKFFLGLLVLNGALVRVAVMALANFLLFAFLLPETYFPVLTAALEKLSLILEAAIGLKIVVTSDLQAVWISVGILSIYNAIHVLVSMIPAYFLLKGILKTPAGKILNSWEK